MPHLRAAHGADGTGRLLVSVSAGEGSENLSERSAPTTATRRSSGARVAVAACLGVLAAVGLQACGGGSVSEAVPKSTPHIVPPNNTSAEKAALSTTATSTTATTTTGTTSTSSESSSGSESSGSESSGSSGGTSEAGSSGGSAASESEKAASKETEKAPEKATENSGGASAP